MDLPNQSILLHTADEEPEEEALETIHFEIDAGAKQRLTQGLDDIAMTLTRESILKVFEDRHDPQLFC